MGGAPLAITIGVVVATNPMVNRIFSVINYGRYRVSSKLIAATASSRVARFVAILRATREMTL